MHYYPRPTLGHRRRTGRSRRQQPLSQQHLAQWSTTQTGSTPSMSIGVDAAAADLNQASLSMGEGTAAFVFTVRHDQSGPEHGVPDACTGSRRRRQARATNNEGSVQGKAQHACNYVDSDRRITFSCGTHLCQNGHKRCARLCIPAHPPIDAVCDHHTAALCSFPQPSTAP